MASPIADDPASAPAPTGIDVEIGEERGPVERLERPWRTVEVWTQNRRYVMDQTLTCVEVRDRASGSADGRHTFLGSRLVGGQRSEGGATELTYPLPRPGTEAVFEHADDQSGFSRTSPVERVILRVHVVTVDAQGADPTWRRIRDSVAPKKA